MTKNMSIDKFASAQGIIITGANNDDHSGYSVNDIGDINGDGYSDIAIGAPNASSNAGATNVIYGKPGGFTQNIDLANLTPEQGFSLYGCTPGDENGYAVAGADINGDGVNDIIFGTPGAYGNAGGVTVVYGKKDGLSSMSMCGFETKSQEGAVIIGATQGDRLGSSIAVGDINKNGVKDIIIGAPNSYAGAGGVYVIWGKIGFYSINILGINNRPSEGAVVNGCSPGDKFGISVSTGDINGDGTADIAVGASGSYLGAGAVYVLWGKSSFDNIAICGIDQRPDEGVVIMGCTPTTPDQDGFSVAVGDVNGDGIADVIIGAPGSYRGDGSTYVIWGNKNLGNISICGIDQRYDEGVVIVNCDGDCPYTTDQAGYAVSIVDINVDGVYDIIIGVPGSNSNQGMTYVIYGGYGLQNTYFPILTTEQGFSIKGTSPGGRFGAAVSSTANCLIVGAPNAPDVNHSKGESYVICQTVSTTAPTVDPTSSPTANKPSEQPTIASTEPPTVALTFEPTTNKPSLQPTVASTNKPSAALTNYPTVSSTSVPTSVHPSTHPTIVSTISPTVTLTFEPTTNHPSIHPTITSTNEPSIVSTGAPTVATTSVPTTSSPNTQPTNDPTIATGTPTLASTSVPTTNTPSEQPSSLPISNPSTVPTIAPTMDSTSAPTTSSPSVQFTSEPTVASTNKPNVVLTIYPTVSSTLAPTTSPNTQPTNAPVHQPNVMPTNSPTNAGRAPVIDLGKLHPNQGFPITGAYGGWNSVSGIGDFNGDRYNDVIVSSNDDKNVAYIIFGSKELKHPNSVNVHKLTPEEGISISRPYFNILNSDVSVSNAGDINGDKIEDIIIGLPYKEGFKGVSYVVYGGQKLQNIDLSNLGYDQGFEVTGSSIFDLTGFSVDKAGDLNKDGYADIIIGAWSAKIGTGISYVIYGEKNIQNIDLGNTNSWQGFSITGSDKFDSSGFSVSSAGDFNGDGYDDVLIGAPGKGICNKGESYVIFGGPSIIKITQIDLNKLTPEQGISIYSTSLKNANSLTGIVSNVGDLNNDGKSEIIIGAPGANGYSGKVYLVYGTDNKSNIDLDIPEKNKIAIINGIHQGDTTGISVSGLGDVNGDGVNDFIIGAAHANKYTGKAYGIYGKETMPTEIDLARLTSDQGFIIKGPDNDSQIGWSVSAIGDVNGDGFADIGIRGESTCYIVYGSKDGFVKEGLGEIFNILDTLPNTTKINDWFDAVTSIGEYQLRGTCSDFYHID